MRQQEENVCDVLVIGAGISGLSVAWHLRQLDSRSLKITIIDGKIENSTSWSIPGFASAGWQDHIEARSSVLRSLCL